MAFIFESKFPFSIFKVLGVSLGAASSRHPPNHKRCRAQVADLTLTTIDEQAAQESVVYENTLASITLYWEFLGFYVGRMVG